MSEAIVNIRFPLGALPVRGYRCAICANERVSADELETVQKLAHELGLFGVEDVKTRKLLRTGNSVAVSIDPELLRLVLPGAVPGTAVRIGRQGERIVVLPA